VEVTVKVPLGAGRVAVVGSAERNLKLLREALSVGVHAREGRVVISGGRHPVSAARRVLEALVEAAERDEPFNRQQVLDLIAEETAQAQRASKGWRAEGRRVARGADADAPFGVDGPDALEAGEDDHHWEDRLNVYVGGKAVRPRTPNQEAYLRAIRQHDLVFGLGPAGTGKTYLAVAAAVHLLRAGRVKRVVLTRPAVEAGEKLGYLPGDLREKVHPYLRPLFDALNDMMDFSTARRFMDNDVVEVVPLAFMRGRTLNHSVIILDEAQNCTKSQMMMFLTRMGQGSKMIVTGDPTQTDLPEDTPSGLLDAAGRLARTSGVAFVGFQQQDIVRHDLVRRIIDAYDDDRADVARAGARRPGRRGEAPRSPKTSASAGSEGHDDRSREGASEPGHAGSMNDEEGTGGVAG
jgi:phosphate starvation-inducible PhoH-like protein